MTGATEAFEAIVGLAFGGFLFLLVGGTLTSSTSITPLMDFRLWGVIYLIVAVVLAVVTVYAAVLSIVN